MSEPCYDARYLVLHFLNGKLRGTKITRTWRGALASKRNHEQPYERLVKAHPQAREIYDAATRIVPIEAILDLPGMDRPDTDLTPDDLLMMKRWGISDDTEQ
jgi:hypothetical protein